MWLQSLLIKIVITAYADLVVFGLALAYLRRIQAAIRITALFSSTIILFFWGYSWNKWAGALFLPLLVHIFFWASLALVSQSLFPLVGWEKRKEAFKVMASFLFGFHRSSYVIDGGKAQERISGHLLSRYGSGVILVGVANAAVMQTSTQFSRVIGPGAHFTKRLEWVKTVVDLHSQTRGAMVKARTKDAVPVEAPVFCLSRIASKESGEAFPFSEEAIRRVIYRQDGVDEEDEGYYWDDYVLQTAVARFQEIMARFRLDQLFEPHDPDQVPRSMLFSALQTAIRNDVSKRGIELLFAGFGTLEFPESVQEQRIASWGAEWAAQAESREAVGEADAERRVHSARAAAQWELAQGLISGLSVAQGLTGIEPADLVAWQLLNAMEFMSADPITQPRLPQDTLNALLTIRGWLENPDLP